ncbi:hypothetical protein Pla163_35920 [Planctomycetes bacterium Pla163]|uniref:Uncharacterized protein n=1 Tax=Rohdeia mirabilis TaxID=2528008 RepID=A0A518D4N7_9BACT|nr:hypothetical protein Pla163_35920 [Planctomycetes bacterium Pla163]
MRLKFLALAAAFLVVGPSHASAPSETILYECGEQVTILDSARLRTKVTPVFAASHGTTPDDMALHEFLVRQRYLEDVECVDECPNGPASTCQPGAIFTYDHAAGAWGIPSGDYVVTFTGVEIVRGCSDCL